MITRRFRAPDTSYFLFGPRGTGKSTWLKATYPTGLYIDLLDKAFFRKLSARPEFLEEYISGKSSRIIIIDEIQKIPDLLDVIHRLIEQKKYQFVLTGSNARKLKRTHANLLAGRAILKKFHPFTAAELGEQFSLQKALTNGLLPLVWDHENPHETLTSYIDLHLKEEVQQEGLTRNVGNFSRFLESISFSHGGSLNISNVARECEIKRVTATAYVEILEDLLLATLLPVFTKKAKRLLTTHPKFYYFDTGVFHYLRPKGPLDAQEEIHGQALEGLVFQHLQVYVDQLPDAHKVYFWRTKNGLEVDFIVYGPTCFLAIEVKNARQIHPKDLHGLKEFQKDYPQAKLLFLYRGDSEIKKSGISCVPVEMFLETL